jgi:hypothetical protein
MIPKAQMILGYEELFGETTPENRLDIIKMIPKLDLVAEFSGLNNRLKPKKSVSIDHSLSLQLELLEYYIPNRNIHSRFKEVFQKYSFYKNGVIENYPLLFTRPTCLFALEEIINCDDLVETDKSFIMGKEENWVAFLQYLAAVNSEITKIKKVVEENASFEAFNVKTIALNELTVETDLFFTPYRGLSLIRYLLQKSQFNKEITQYFMEIYSLDSEKYIYEILSMYYSNSTQDEKMNFYYLVKEGDTSFFEHLSNKIDNDVPFKLINIRKNPFFKDSSRKNSFFLLDNMLLLEKSYSQFLSTGQKSNFIK